jgi:D-alanyl-D-alanine carboxypeptidase
MPPRQTGPPPGPRPRPPVPLTLAVALVAVVLVAVALIRLRDDVTAGGAPSPMNRTTASSRPSSTPSRPAAPSAAQLPACRYGDSAAPHQGYGEWASTLLDTSYGLPVGYAPPDLAEIERAGFIGASDDLAVRRFVIDDLAALRRAAAEAGAPIGVLAAYRSYEQQAGLFSARVKQFGYRGALARVARPGHSEHQLGTTLDFKTPGERDVTPAWAYSEAGRWLAANAYRFGFVLSYPANRSALTCYTYEPWHFRYVGRVEAARIEASGVTVRQYLWQEIVGGRGA